MTAAPSEGAMAGPAAPAAPASSVPTPPHPTTTLLPTAIATDSTTPKLIHSLVLDTGPLIKNEVPVSTLLAQAEVIYTIPAVISEIRDEATRSRLQTTLIPFLKLRSPRAESVKFVSDFARKTGDLQVLSKPDIHLIALTYELECERNNGDWRLRREPGQKTVNGKPPSKQVNDSTSSQTLSDEAETSASHGGNVDSGEPKGVIDNSDNPPDIAPQDDVNLDDVQSQVQDLSIESIKEDKHDATTQIYEPAAEEAEDDSDSDGWITPSNIKKHHERDGLMAKAPDPAQQKMLQACLLTSDYAMQNVSLRVNLNCVGPSLRRITHLKTWVLRCHGCFAVTRQMDRQFCPKCGQSTLTRTSCSTDADGTFRLHLKRNFQWNNRGNVYSIPKPTHGSASGKGPTGGGGGGKNGWGRELILAEDQKEYSRKVQEEKRTKYHDLMDEDYLPNILSGARSGGNGRIKVGAGRNINSKKRR